MANKLEDFKPQKKNANKHTEYGMQMLEKSMGEVGFIGAMTAANDGEIFDGSARIEKSVTVFEGVEPIVVETDGTRPVIVKRTDIENADDPRAVRAGILANRVFEVDLDWDVDVLAELADDDMLDGLFTDKELIDLGAMEQESKDAEPQIDRAEELRQKWGVETGQTWQVGEHVLYIGDYLDANLSGDALVFDPPWDQKFDFDFSGFENILAFSDGQRIGDVIRYLGAPAWEFIWDTGASWYTPNRPLKKHKNCYWYGNIDDYNQEGYFFEHDAKKHTVKNTRGTYIYEPDIRGKRLLDVYAESITKTHSDGASHGKPLEWVAALLANCTKGVIVDPFCGTGTSIIAAQMVGRRCVASEIDLGMVGVILERCYEYGMLCKQK